jgi:hypothetical protein
MLSVTVGMDRRWHCQQPTSAAVTLLPGLDVFVGFDALEHGGAGVYFCPSVMPPLPFARIYGS